MKIEQLNQLDAEAARQWFMQTCTSTTWCQQMVEARPFASLTQLLDLSKKHWQACTDEDVLEALAGHPMIGDITTLRAKYATTKSLAKGEQSGMDSASDALLTELKDLNQRYLDKHGFIFIICASGLSAEAMLNAIKARVDNDTALELATAAQEQLKITGLRIDKALQENGFTQESLS